MPLKPVDYQKTIIYKIVCNDLSITDTYVGHTTDFNARRARHKHACMFETNKLHYTIYKTIRNNGGWDNWKMVEVEKFPCNDRNEAAARERFWYEILNGNMNMKKPRADKPRERKISPPEHNEEFKREWINGNADLYHSNDNSCDEGR